MNREELVELLKDKIVNIEYEKLDGSIRKMIATRSPDHIPEGQLPSGETVKDRPELSTVAVFDMSVCGWRSVYPEKVVVVNE